MAPNNQVEISINLGDAMQRMEELKTKFGDQFQSHEDGANNSQRKLLHKSLLGEKQVVISELYEAVKKGDVDNFVQVLAQVCEKKKLPLSNVFDHVTWEGDSLVHVAANLEKEEIVKLICQHFHDHLVRKNERGDTSLHVAARSNNHTIVRIIISRHDGVKDEMITRQKNEHGNTPLHEAVLCGNVDAVRELIYADKDVVHCLNKAEKSPLYLAVVKGNEEILNLLLEISFAEDQQLPVCFGNSPLHAAILERKPDLIRVILEKRPELVYLRDGYGDTPLHYAAYIGYAEGFDILLENSLHKSDVTPLEKNEKGHLPIHLACKRGHVELVRKFFQHEWHFNPFVLLNKKGQNILHVAANNGKVKVVTYLLKNEKIEDRFINLKDNSGNTPLHLASKQLFPRVLYIIAQDKKRTDVTLLNDMCLTARDIVERQQMSFRKILANQVLKEAGVPLKANNMLNSQDQQAPDADMNKIKDFTEILLVAATLMVTVTFAAAFTVPGGVYSSSDPNQGTAIFAHKPFFWVFTTFNTDSMYCSVIACGLILIAFLLGYTRAIVPAVLCLLFAFFLVPFAFMAAVRLVVVNNSALAIFTTVIGTIYTSLVVSWTLVEFFPVGNRRPVIRHIGRFVLWTMVKSINYDLKPPKESSPQEPIKGNKEGSNQG